MKKVEHLQYTDEQLAQALSDIRNNISSIRQALRNYNVPRSALINKLKGRTSENRKMDPPTILTPEEENILVRWICACANKGFPLNKRLLCDTVKNLIEADDRINPFKENLPGYKWFKAFL